MIEVYSRTNPYCPYCVQAKASLAKHEVKEYKIYDLDTDYTLEDLREKFPQAKTFPVVVVDGEYIGGANELQRHLVAQKGRYKPQPHPMEVFNELSL